MEISFNANMWWTMELDLQKVSLLFWFFQVKDILDYLNWMVVVVWFSKDASNSTSKWKKINQEIDCSEVWAHAKQPRPCRAVLILDPKRNVMKSSMTFRGDSLNIVIFHAISGHPLYSKINNKKRHNWVSSQLLQYLPDKCSYFFF